MEIGAQILDARETRYNFVLKLIKEYKRPVLCAKLNYPGIIKNTSESKHAFSLLKNIVKAEYSVDFEGVFSCVLEGHDGESFILVLSKDSYEEKKKAVEIETYHELGRILDIDIYDLNGNPIDRKAVNMEPRACIVCGKNAFECIKSEAHRKEAVFDEVNKMIHRVMLNRDDLSKRISEAAILSMLYEISTYPSPGLVSPNSSGAHSDMDYFTFLRSTSAISTAMLECALVGVNEESDYLNKLRKIGIEAEKRMFKITEGVNTQKGLLFLLGIVCCAAGICVRLNMKITRETISKYCIKICEGIVHVELHKLKKTEDICDSNIKTNVSNGQRLYIKNGIKGIRGEVELGVPTVINAGLPYYEKALESGLQTREALAHSLIGIMSVIEDTTVLNRCGDEGLKMMRDLSAEALSLGGMLTENGSDFIHNMDKIFTERNISPGGAADLLAITAMIYELEKMEV